MNDDGFFLLDLPVLQYEDIDRLRYLLQELNRLQPDSSEVSRALQEVNAELALRLDSSAS